MKSSSDMAADTDVEVLHAPWVDYLLRQNPVVTKFFRSQMRMIDQTASMVTSRLRAISADGLDNRHDMLSKLVGTHQQRPEEVPARRLIGYADVYRRSGGTSTGDFVLS